MDPTPSNSMQLEPIISTQETKQPSKEPKPAPTVWEEVCTTLDPRGAPWMTWLLLAIPIAIALWASDQNAGAQFVFSAIAIIPLAGFMGEGTEAIASHAGPGIGGLLNATFGNAAELIIALFGVFKHLDSVVKASLSGSMIGNVLLVLGCSMLTGGARYKVQYFNKDAAATSATMAIMASIGLIIPAFVHNLHLASNEHGLSKGVSVILIVSYCFLLLFSLVTHSSYFDEEAGAAVLYDRDKTKLQSQRRALEGAGLTTLQAADSLEPPAEQKEESAAEADVQSDDKNAAIQRTLTGRFGRQPSNLRQRGLKYDEDILKRKDSRTAAALSPTGTPAPNEHEGPDWSLRKAIVVLLVSTAFVAFMSEILVGSVESAGEAIGISHVFMGFIILAIVGNAAEHSTAIVMAYKDRMDISVNIALGSTLQIALFVAPLLCLISYARDEPMDLVFSSLEVFSIFLALIIVWMVLNDGASTWVEGFMLLMLYCILGVAFAFIDESAEDV